MNKHSPNPSKLKSILFSEYSFIQVFLNVNAISGIDVILFMPKTAYYKYPRKFKRNLLKGILKVFFPNTLIQEVLIDEVIGHYWISNALAAKQLSSLKAEFLKQKPYELLNDILDDPTVVNYFQASLGYDVMYQNLFSIVSDQESKKYSNLISIGDLNYLNRYESIFFKMMNFLTTLRYYLFCCMIPIYFFLMSLRNGFVIKPSILKSKLSTPIVSGIQSGETSFNFLRGTKISNDDSVIFGKNINYEDAILVFNFWKFTPDLKEFFKNNMRDMGIRYIDTERLKIDYRSFKYTCSIASMVIRHPFRFFNNYNNWYVLRMNSFLPKAILHILQKQLEIKHLKPEVEIIKNDYNPASILRSIISKKSNIKTIGISHTATSYDCPQICFVHFDYYLLLGELYRKNLENYLDDVNVIVNGKDFLDPVILLTNDQEKKNEVQRKFKKIYGQIENKLLIILPGNSPIIKKNMRIKMVNAIKKWSDESKKNDHIIIRFRRKIETETVEEWREIFSLSQSNERIIIDFEQFTTQELMYISDRIIVPHSSYAMTEAMALDKEAFSFDFSGSATHYFGSYGKGLVMSKEKELYNALFIDNDSLSKQIDYEKLSKDLDPFYDGRSVERLQELVMDLTRRE